MQLILQRKHGERRRCESCGALPAWLALPYGVGEGASAWGLGSRMVAGNTHTHTQQNSKTRQKRNASLVVAMQKQHGHMQIRRRHNKEDDKDDEHQK